MDWLGKLPREAVVVLAAGLLYVLLSFFDWQRHSFGAAGVYGQSLWHGFGIIVALTAIALLGWEVARALGVTVEYDSVDTASLSAWLALALSFFTLIVFLAWSEYRAWPQWLGTLLSLAIGGAAFMRARAEDVQLLDPERLRGIPGADRVEERLRRVALELPFRNRPLAVPAAAVAAAVEEEDDHLDAAEHAEHTEHTEHTGHTGPAEPDLLEEISPSLRFYAPSS